MMSEWQEYITNILWEWKKEMGALLKILNWIKMFIHLTWTKDWDMVKSQPAYSGSYTAFQGWNIDYVTFTYFEIHVE